MELTLFTRLRFQYLLLCAVALALYFVMNILPLRYQKAKNILLTVQVVIIILLLILAFELSIAAIQMAMHALGMG